MFNFAGERLYYQETNLNTTKGLMYFNKRHDSHSRSNNFNLRIMRKILRTLGMRCAVATIAILSSAPVYAFTPEKGKIYAYSMKDGGSLHAKQFYSFDINSPTTGTILGNAEELGGKAFEAGTFLSNGEFIGFYKSASGEFVYKHVSLKPNGYWGDICDPQYSSDFLKVSDLAYDGETVYAWYQDNNSVWSLGKVNINNGVITRVGKTSDMQMMAITAGNGTLYGIGKDEYVYSISPSSGAISKLTILLKSLNGVAQSASFDSASGTIIWAKQEYYTDPEIVSVNPENGECTTLATLPDSPQLIGLYIVPTANAATPGPVTGLTATNNGANNDVVVSFTMPAVSSTGDALDANIQGLTYTIKVDEQTVIDKKASTVGAAVSETLTTTPGNHTITVVASVGDEDSRVVTTDLFVGEDAPGAVKDAKAVADGNNVTITWAVPDGANGGNYDNAKLAYKVVRMPGNVTVAESTTATTASDVIYTDVYKAFSYVISTIYDNAEVASATSTKVLAGPAFEVTAANPYYVDFENSESADDAGFFCSGTGVGDGEVADPTLKIVEEGTNKYLKYDRSVSGYQVSKPKVFTTAIKFIGKHTYRLSYSFRCGQNGTTFGMYLSDSPTAKCKNVKTLRDAEEYGYNAKDWEQFSDTRVAPVEFTVEKTGIYFVSIQHDYSSCDWDFDNFKVEDVTKPAVPNAPTEMTAVTEVPGSRKVTVSFRLPAEDKNGNDPKLSSVVLKCGDNVINTWTENLEANSMLTYVHENAPLGNLTYSVTVTNAAGTSVPATAEVKVGHDHNLSIVSSDAPESTMKGKTVSISATVRNNGILKAPHEGTTYTLSLMRKSNERDASVVKSWEGEALESNAEKTFTHTMEMANDAAEKETYFFNLAYEPDQDLTDNQSREMEIAVGSPETPVPTELRAVWNEEGSKYDLTWKAPAYNSEDVTLSGYEVYCNKEKVSGDNLVKETSFSYPVDKVGDFAFYVVAVYNTGSSLPSETFNTTNTGVDAIADGSLQVESNGDVLTVKGVQGNVAVYTLTGVRLASAEANGSAVEFRLADGLYILNANGRSLKICM